MGKRKIKLPLRQLSYRETLSPAMELRTQEEADDYFDALVDWHVNMGHYSNRMDAERVVRINIGYYAGYYDYETQERVYKLFKTCHPFFGGPCKKPGNTETFPVCDTQYGR